MVIASLSIPSNYWDNLEFDDSDLEFIYNHLLEIETPLTVKELTRELINHRISSETNKLEKQQQMGRDIYVPKNRYQVGQTLLFPAIDARGTVKNIRKGNNPEHPGLEVLDIDFSDGTTKSFASGIENHALNELPKIDPNNPLLNQEYIGKTYGKKLSVKLNTLLESSSDLVEIAGRWFPSALLVDVNQGYLNLAEAVLEMENGGPLATTSILNQIELPTDVNIKLTEFSLNYALQEDDRFDEVGPAGETLWFLNRMEPEGVQTIPAWLRPTSININNIDVSQLVKQLDPYTCDELDECQTLIHDEEINELTIRLIYPHWRAGTLPLTSRIASLFPTAYESPRVQFTFVDGETGDKFNGWVVRNRKYVYGLRDWYLSLGMMPGALITIKRSTNPGEIILTTGKRRPTKDWVRTALIGADGGIVFALLKQQINTPLDEHMGIVLSNPQALDSLWEQPKQRQTFEQLVMSTMRELSKLNPQGHVHTEELYASVNLLRRCPPTPILQLLKQSPWAHYMGDLYFRIDENNDGRQTDE